MSDWIRRGRPAMVRRRMAWDAPGDAPLAIQLPNALGRLRRALTAPEAAVRLRRSVTLEMAAASAPPAWANTVRDMLALAPEFGMPTVYGGLLWQHVLGETVLRETSDLDLLWHPEPDGRVALIATLARLDRVGPPRLDGEIVLEDGAGVAWRELVAARDGRTETVAVKTLDGVELRALGAILPERASC